MERWLDQGIGGCQLAAEEIRAELMTCLHRFDGERHHLHAYVVMPNHVHLLIEPTAGDTLATLLKGIKGASAKLINARLGRTGAFWQDESHDHIVRSEAQYEHYRAYIRGNPGKAKLAAGRYALYDAFAQTKMSAPRFSQTGMSVLPSGMPVSRWAAAEEFIYTDPADPLVNWDEATLATELAAAGFCEVRSDRALATHPRRIPPAQLDRWFADTPGSYARRLLAAGLDADDLRQFRAALTAAVAGREVPWTTTTLFLHATAP
ncbi:MAG: transposase [Lentisphaeria bacterium]